MIEIKGKSLSEFVNDKRFENVTDMDSKRDESYFLKDQQHPSRLHVLGMIYTSCDNINTAITNLSKELSSDTAEFSSDDLDVADATIDALQPVIVNLTSMICALKKSIDPNDYATLTSHVDKVGKFKKIIELTNDGLKKYLE